MLNKVINLLLLILGIAAVILLRRRRHSTGRNGQSFADLTDDPLVTPRKVVTGVPAHLDESHAEGLPQPLSDAELMLSETECTVVEQLADPGLSQERRAEILGELMDMGYSYLGSSDHRLQEVMDEQYERPEEP